MSTQLLLTYDFPPMGGGIARMMGELARRYPPGSLVVSTGQYGEGSGAAADFPNVVDRLGIPSRRLRTLQGLVLWSRRAAALARSLQPEFVWCGNLKPGGYPARWIRQRVGTPYGIVVYGTDLLLLQSRIGRSAVKRQAGKTLIGSAAVVVAISRWTRDLCLAVLDELGLGGKLDVRIVPLGTDPVRFRPGIDQGSVRARYGLEGGRWLLTVARLSPHKGIDIGLRVLARLREVYPDLGYAVVGSGAQLSTLEGMAKKLGVTDRVRFLTAVPDSDLPAVYNSAEVYLGLSRVSDLSAEGFGISLVEASASGIPVVAGRGGGIPEAVRDGETGILVDSEQPEEVSRALCSLLEDRTLAQRLGAAGRRAVESYYNWDRVTADFADIGHELGVPAPQEVAHR
ncbi:MAG TPA: glycosyltransferase family 4 protein [Gemmatimonadales bacterium]|jgi:phosphatidylinositol alpha-1,6-mannosyltransferase|nr:glycosyltransferase family 4 protein [Gemmatimonadales bacterium]